MEAIAKHDFTATADDELSFRKGQVLKLTGNQSFGILAKKNAENRRERARNLFLQIAGPADLGADVQKEKKNTVMSLSFLYFRKCRVRRNL
ncbi:hypothetical protein MTO96_026237 [Rhipicephalus appendiculatus]